MTVPEEMTLHDITSVRKAFVDAARRAHQAGFRVIEIHAAHGYLLHEFLSPLSNHRTDSYGGSFEGRIRMLLEVTAQVRVVWPESLPLFVRISATDWDDRGWTVDESVELARRLKPLGVDVVDCSSGGSVAKPTVPFGLGLPVRNGGAHSPRSRGNDRGCWFHHVCRTSRSHHLHRPSRSGSNGPADVARSLHAGSRSSGIRSAAVLACAIPARGAGWDAAQRAGSGRSLYRIAAPKILFVNLGIPTIANVIPARYPVAGSGVSVGVSPEKRSAAGSPTLVGYLKPGSNKTGPNPFVE